MTETKLISSLSESDLSCPELPADSLCYSLPWRIHEIHQFRQPQMILPPLHLHVSQQQSRQQVRACVPHWPRCCSEAKHQPLLFQPGQIILFRNNFARKEKHLECRGWQEIPRAVCAWRWLSLNFHVGECWRKVTTCGEVWSVLSSGQAADTSNLPDYMYKEWENTKKKGCLSIF